jgi:hypothetical protein
VTLSDPGRPDVQLSLMTDGPWGVRRFFVRDPDGNVVNVLGHGATLK